MNGQSNIDQVGAVALGFYTKTPRDHGSGSHDRSNTRKLSKMTSFSTRRLRTSAKLYRRRTETNEVSRARLFRTLQSNSSVN